MTSAIHPILYEVEAAEIRRGAMHLARRLRAARPEGALSSGKLGILSHLVQRGPMTPGKLASAEFLRPQSLTRMLAELEAEGLVNRSRHQFDGRQSLIAITGEGREAMARDVASRDAWLAQAMAQLSRTERDVLRIAARLMEELADDDPRHGPAASGKPVTPPRIGR
jgi:DNA-binding MarR family transcriptional regulator